MLKPGTDFATMRCLSHPLLRRLLGLAPQCVPGRLSQSQGPILSPKQSSLRQNCSTRPGFVTATDVVNYWQKVFETNGIPEARESSEYIVSFALGAKTFQSLNSKSLHTPLTAVQQEQIQQLSNKRLERMPVQYVLGEWDFQDLTLKMRPPVFIPRPETEDLVSLVVEEESRKCEKNSGLCFQVPVSHPVILEIGCGSGAIALSLLCKLPQSQVIAVDKEEAAVDLTKENAHRLQLQERIHIFHHDVSYSSAEQLLLWGPIDFIVSNPPYVFHEDMASLDTEVLRYEDLDALDGGDDGMRVIKTILALASSLLKDSGSVFLEVDPRHPDMVDSWLQAHPNLLLVLRAIHKDFCGKHRFLHIQKQSR
ncbi:MTRF1L release factor glutamine methyltransferase isoform X1 [Falco biarmicus]|uniref:MTRF1L release factor glutamine methyltransferase isoform X1 n=2 Tax=Falco cherrug TaxID=345164 RepID=UPI000FFCA761|nr:MTRF1L release factor glutamine methyltransferase isoform X1 [Falco cherrug]XP_037238927.1 MTRF1L release factor glutamine methyltransferase isoform X2 [Falco rusticolus]XP_055564128.1 MTRF1L release factor glutamine methyltransferase isoform X1 [Falco cherrug]XP_055660980.1 MTRF1L release factor glutamine methyltransferase isoform X1 [Falco peregrinus]XP_055660981.1 MTRF1L release factor glutamine methyltransferase isoform X1 [Falco peregrinus]XP_056191589.1 MTRF1L release factor glutamine